MFREEDCDDYARFCADPEVTRFLGGKTFNRLEAWRHMAFFIGRWQLRGYGHWAVEEKQSRRLVGRLGFLNPQDWPGFELGWMLGRKYWGRGYATEAARRAMERSKLRLAPDLGNQWIATACNHNSRSLILSSFFLFEISS